mmetsp:Transcript_23377/g.65659  ORF Transcript_23377/g.65659 Transcript_23377/m.65659 type:complete len:450 (+) Transcript_23377:220-1569(+)|eukprot:CAMPEP_0119122676 /NCGR_PEP_ID=MMETSP1310-20130426/2865_1 /TAXON_ID=464262 /ORGANISM="Genus nov. species nov., Strain RCC2339" /LENGTH=449 /DNA_ID=CAMNT_0007112373 /DNA_START=195 /DNA_END=1544 /DNA_ORIENTATION=+
MGDQFGGGAWFNPADLLGTDDGSAIPVHTGPMPGYGNPAGLPQQTPAVSQSGAVGHGPPQQQRHPQHAAGYGAPPQHPQQYHGGHVSQHPQQPHGHQPVSGYSQGGAGQGYPPPQQHYGGGHAGGGGGAQRAPAQPARGAGVSGSGEVVMLGMSGPPPPEQVEEAPIKPPRNPSEDFADLHHGPWAVSITAVEARNLIGSPMVDSYVRVQSYAETLRTRVIKRNLNPSWNQTMNFSIQDPLGKDWTQGVCIEVVNYNEKSQHQILGRAKCCLGEMKHGVPNDVWFYLKDPTTKEVVPGRLHAVIVVRGGPLVAEGEEIKKTEAALLSSTKTTVTKKVTRKRVIGPDGQPVVEDVQVKTTIRQSGSNIEPAKELPDGTSSTHFSPVQPDAMLKDQPRKRKEKGIKGKVKSSTQSKNTKQKKGFKGSEFYSSNMADAFGEEDEPEDEWEYT